MKTRGLSSPTEAAHSWPCFSLSLATSTVMADSQRDAEAARPDPIVWQVEQELLSTRK